MTEPTKKLSLIVALLAVLSFTACAQNGPKAIDLGLSVKWAAEDTSSRYKMVFYLPDGWDDSYPLRSRTTKRRDDCCAGCI